MRQNYKFNQRIIDKESDPRYVSPGKIIDATNCRIDDSGNVVNLRGNKAIATLLPAGHVCIGAKKHKDWIYYFSTNDIQSNIGRYNVVTDTNSILNLSNAVLNFNSTSYIDFIDFLDDEENGKLLMYWTDGVNPPRYCDWLNTVAYSFDAAFFSVLKAPPFYEPKIRCLVLGDDAYGDGDYNAIERKMLQFAFRYIYADGSISALSSRSRTAFYHNQELPGNDDSKSNILSNYFNAIEITIPLGSPIENLHKQVTSIEVYSIDINLGQAFLINTIVNYGNVLEFKFDFQNSSNYPTLSPSEYGKLFDSVPSMSKVQCLAEDRIFYGNYSDGINNDITPLWSVNIISSRDFEFFKNYPTEYHLSIQDGASEKLTVLGNINRGDILYFVVFVKNNTTSIRIKGINLMLVAEESYSDLQSFIESSESRMGELIASKGLTYTFDTPAIMNIGVSIANSSFFGRIQYHVIPSHVIVSLRRGVRYDYAMCYFNEFGIPGELIEKKGIFSKKYNSSSSTSPYRSAVVNIRHLAPVWAKKFKLYRKEKKYHTVIISNPTAKYFGSEIYIKIPESQNPEIPDNSLYIELIATRDYPFRYVDYKAVSCDINKIVITDSEHLLGAGRWIVIDPQHYPGYDSVSLESNDPLVNLYLDGIFEITTAEATNDEVYKEIPGVFEIDSNRYHRLDSGAEAGAWSRSQFGAGFDEGFIKELFYDGDVIYGIDDKSSSKIMSYTSNDNMYSQLGRPQILSESYRELNRKFSVTYSSKYNYETGENGLSSFNVGLINFKDYPREYGAVKSIFYRDTDVVVYQEDKVIRQPYNKNVIEAIGGGGVLTSSQAVLGQFTAYAGEYGMSHAESFAFRDNQLFWVDIKRGVILRLSQDGIFPISNFGMRTYFKNLFEGIVGNIRTEGFYDYSKDEYGISIPGEGVWHFNHSNQGWTHRINISPDILFYDGLGLYSFNGLDLYKHNELDSENFNTFYGVAIPLSFELSINEGFSDIKTLHSLFIEGDKGIIELKDQEGNITTIPEDLFENKEGVWYCFVPMNSTSSDNINMFGLGVITGRSAHFSGSTKVTFGYEIRNPQIGDILKTNTAAGVVSGIDAGNSILADFTVLPTVGEFAFIERSNIISGDYMRGNYFLLKFTVEDNTKEVKVFAINVEANKSEV